MLALVTCAVFALRGQPWRHYAGVYFVSGALSYASQFVFSGVFKFYTYRSHWIEDPFRDERLMALFVLGGIDPLFCVLYARYCRRHPILLAVGFALVIGMLEWLFAQVGAMEYPVGWGPPISIAFSIAAFLVVWRLAVNQIPLWLHVDAMAFLVAQMPDTLFNGVMGLYRYWPPWALTADPRIDSRILAVSESALMLAPLAAWIALHPWRRPLIAILTGALVLTVLEWIGWMYGWVTYHGWNLGLSAIYYVCVFLLPWLYARFLRKQRRKPPPWKPPVRP